MNIGRGWVQGHIDERPPMGRWWWIASDGGRLTSWTLRAWAAWGRTKGAAT